jgi:hypothetical protein
MTPKPTSIFRSQALDAYIANREQAVLPKYVTPRIFALLWLLLAISFIAMALVLLATPLRSLVLP